MPAISWELYSVVRGKNDILTVTIRELTDGAPTLVKTLADGTQIYRTCSVSMHKSRTETDFKGLLKGKILADRAKRTEETTQATKFDFSNFEDHVNS